MMFLGCPVLLKQEGMSTEKARSVSCTRRKS